MPLSNIDLDLCGFNISFDEDDDDDDASNAFAANHCIGLLSVINPKQHYALHLYFRKTIVRSFCAIYGFKLV
jgi:hypothetical protein